MILMGWSRVMSPECIYRVENKQKDQDYWGNRYFSGWADVTLCGSVQEGDLRILHNALSRAIWTRLCCRQQGRVTWRVQSPCNSCLWMVPPTWSAKSVQVFTEFWGIEGQGSALSFTLRREERAAGLAQGTVPWHGSGELISPGIVSKGRWHREGAGSVLLHQSCFSGLFVGKEGPMIHSGAVVGAGLPQVSADMGHCPGHTTAL